MTWYDVKLATLQKMFSTEGTDINKEDDAVSEYINAMPYACNEALALLSTSNKFIRQSFEVDSKVITIDELPDYHSLGERIEAYYIDDEDMPTPIDVKLMAGRLIFPMTPAVLYYNAWPEKITHETPDNYEFPLYDDVVVLLPLYMAGELYKDDDISVATIYRNEFEAARAELYNVPDNMENVFTNYSGW